MRKLCIALLGLLATSAWGATFRAEGPRLFVNEVGTVTFAGPQSAVRAATLARKLAAIQPNSVSSGGTGRAATLRANDRVLVTVTLREARRLGSTPGALVQRWAAAINRSLALPELRAERDRVRIPVGGVAEVALVGSMARKAPISVSPGAGVTVVREGATLKLRGARAGEARITLTGKSSTLVLAASVEPYAVNFPQNLQVTVTGNTAAGAMVSDAVRGAIFTRLRTVPNARVEIDPVRIGDLPLGERRQLSVPVSVSAPGAFPAKGEVTVQVANVPLATRPEAELWYCNDPENVDRPTHLFRGTLQRDRPVRLLYHHINTGTSGLILRVDLVNLTNEPARIAITPGDSVPDRNPVRAGFVAANAFLDDWLLNSAEIIDLPPRSTVPISLRRLGPQETSSGLCTLRVLSGSAVEVFSRATLPSPLLDRGGQPLNSPTPWREVPVAAYDGSLDGVVASASGLVFPQPFREEEFRYEVGGRFAFFRLGERAIPRADGGKPLDGNFGVIYRVRAVAANRTDRARNVEVVYESSAGYNGAIFRVDGTPLRVFPLQPKQEVRLARFRLEPGEERSVSILTLPLSGSSYPATLVIRPVDSL